MGCCAIAIATSRRRWSPWLSRPAGRFATSVSPSCSSATSPALRGLGEDAAAAERLPAPRMPGLGGQHRIVARGHLRKQRRELKRARQAALADLVRGAPGYVVAGKAHTARRRLDDAGDEVEQRRLAGAVGSDDGAHLAVGNLHADVVHGNERAVTLRQTVDLEQWARGCTGIAAGCAQFQPWREPSVPPPARARLTRLVARPQMPSGANSTTAMKTRPRNSAHASV